jgi:uncharacterized phage protein (TIGR01671 family)
MRNIEFRATRKDTRETFGVLSLDWIHGSVLLDGHMIEVEMDSVVIRQFTGLLDVNGVKIFEEDVVKTSSGVTGEMVYDDCLGFIINGVQIYELGSDQSMKLFEVVGNIHEVQNV